MQPNFNYFLTTILLGLSFSFIFSIAILGIQWYSGAEFTVDSTLINTVITIILYGTILTIVNRYYFDFALKGYFWIKFPKYKLLFAVLGTDGSRTAVCLQAHEVGVEPVQRETPDGPVRKTDCFRR